MAKNLKKLSSNFCLSFLLFLLALLISELQGIPTSIAGVTPRRINCPPAEDISPCECFNDGFLTCSSRNVTQDHIVQLFRRAREVSNSSATTLRLSGFELSRTALKVLDLSPLAHPSMTTTIDLVNIVSNTQLNSVLTNSLGNPKFRVNRLQMNYHALVSNGHVTNALSFVDPAYSPVTLDVSLNRILNVDSGFPIFTGMAVYTKLQNLNLSWTEVSLLGQNHFWALKGLRSLDLTHTGLNKVGQGAFNLSVTHGQTINLILDDNLLIDDRIEEGFIPLPDISDSSDKKQFSVSLRNNYFTFISKEKFGDLVGPNGRIVELHLEGNNFVCDNKMKWLRVEKEKLESIVHGVDCTNDEGKTIFTTSLVSSSSSLGSSIIILVAASMFQLLRNL